MKRKATSPEDSPVLKKQRINGEEARSSVSLSIEPTIEDLPLEIIGNHIFKYFQFHYWWNNFIPVCKRWNQAAIYSNVQKQLIVRRPNPDHVIGLIDVAKRYQITELFIYPIDSPINPSLFTLLLQASKKLVVFAVFGRDSIHPLRADLTFPNITTVAVPSFLLKHFPNATHVELSSESSISDELPKVTDLVMNKRKRLSNSAYESMLRCTPNVQTVYIFHKIDLPKLQATFPKITFVTSFEACKHRTFNTMKTSPLYKARCHSYQEFYDEIKLTSLEHEVDLFSRFREYSFPYFNKDSFDAGTKTKKEVIDEYEDYVVTSSHIDLAQLITFFRPHEMMQILLQRQKIFELETATFVLDNLSSLQQNADPKFFLVAVLNIIGPDQLMEAFSEEELHIMINQSPNYPSILKYYDSYPDEIRFLAPLIDDWSDDTIVESAISKNKIDEAMEFIKNGAKVQIDKLFDRPESHYFELLESDFNQYEEYRAYMELAFGHWRAMIELIIEKEASSVPIKYWLFESDWYKAPFRLRDAILAMLISLGADVQAPQRLPQEFKGGSLYNWLIYQKVDVDILARLSTTYHVKPDQTTLTTAILHAYSRIRYLIYDHKEQFDLQNGFVCAISVKKACHKCIDMIDTFLDAGVDINALGRSIHSTVERTPLMEAVYCRQDSNIIKYLLFKGAKTDLVASNGDTVLHIAIKSHSHISIVSTLISHGADLNRAGHQKLTPLMLTAQMNANDIAIYLLKHSADVNCYDIEGLTYFHHLLANPVDSCDRRLFDLILADYKQQFVKEAKSIIRLTNEKQDSLLLLTVFNKFLSYIDLAKLLIEDIGVDVNTCANGHSLITLAATFEVAEYLIVRGININAQDKYGDSALMLVIKEKVRYREKERFIKLLLDNGADVHLKNDNNVSPIDLEPNIQKYK